MAIPEKLMGNGEGLTALLLTDAESRLIRKVLLQSADLNAASEAFDRGIQRATERIKAEFDTGQKKRKESKR